MYAGYRLRLDYPASFRVQKVADIVCIMYVHRYQEPKIERDGRWELQVQTVEAQGRKDSFQQEDWKIFQWKK